MVGVRGRELIERNPGDAESGTGIFFSLPKRSGNLTDVEIGEGKSWLE